MKNDLKGSQDEDNPNVKQIIIKIRIDKSKGEFANKISIYGNSAESKPILDTIEMIGILESIKQQELKRLFDESFKGEKEI